MKTVTITGCLDSATLLGYDDNGHSIRRVTIEYDNGDCGRFLMLPGTDLGDQAIDLLGQPIRVAVSGMGTGCAIIRAAEAVIVEQRRAE